MEFNKEIEKKVSLLDTNKSACILWLSGLEKAITLDEVKKRWKITSTLLSKDGISQKLAKLDIIKIVNFSGKDGLKFISNIEWVYDIFDFWNKNDFQNWLINHTKSFFPLNNKKEFVETLESEDFRRGCLNLDSFINEINFYHSKDDLTKDTLPFQYRHLTNKGTVFHMLGHWIISFTARLKMLSLFRAFDLYPEFRDYYKKGLFDPELPFCSEYLKNNAIDIYKKYKVSYKVPESIKPITTPENEIKKLRENSKKIKDSWLEVWKGMNKI